MAVLENLQPKEVFHYFEELTNIPHGSADEKAISDYLVNFAKERGLEVIQDKNLNVIIKKPGTSGYENAPTVIIQGHMDMVCEKSKTSKHDFKKDPLQLRIDGDYVYATETTLGADDGIAVAYGLAILDSKTIAHPPMELVVTTEEETGMNGAAALDVSPLKGKILLNIDSEEEGIFLVGCAGGVNTYAKFKASYEEAKGVALKIEVTGLLGGHSGMEIDKQRGNANKLMGRILYEIGKEVCFNIASINGGSKHNAIPLDCQAVITLDEKDVDKVKAICTKCDEDFKGEYRVQDANVKVLVDCAEKPAKQFTKELTKEIVTFTLVVPDGVQSMSMDIKGLVQSSLNIGIIETTDEEIKYTIAVRSSIKSLKYEIVNRIEALAKALNGCIVNENEYPEWEFAPESPIRDLSVKVYEKMYGKEPEISAIHAGLECGLLKEKMPDTDMISFGPNLFDVHTQNEHLSIVSVERVWNFLVELLKEIK